MYQRGSACYGTAQQANTAQASELVGSLVQVGGEPYSVNVSAVTDSSISLDLQQLNGAGVISKTISVTPQPCGLLQIEDGLQIGWMIVAAWIGAFCVVFIARFFRDSINGAPDGNT